MSKHPREIVEEAKKCISKFNVENKYCSAHGEGQYCHLDDEIGNEENVIPTIINILINSHIETLEQEIERLEGMEIDLSVHNFPTEEDVFDWDIPRDIFDYAKEKGQNIAFLDQISHLQQQLSEWRLMK